MGYRWKKVFLSGLFCGKMLLCVCILCGLLSGCGEHAVLYDSGSGGTQTDLPDKSKDAVESGADTGEALQTDEKRKMICVYVCGEVKVPGVYELQEGGRIVDALEAAGGMTEAAADTWLNLAEPLEDGQKIEVPSKAQAEVYRKEEQEAQSGLVNLNTASAEELMTLTGIGESKAQAILSYREEHGGFENPEELMEIPGIKEGVFQKIRDQVTV